MMGIWQKLNPFARSESKENRYGSIGKRAYAGAKVNRLTSSWTITPKPINADIKAGLRALRARSREQAQNNDHVRGFLRMVKTNVIGHQGVMMQSRPPDLRAEGIDSVAAQAIEAEWLRWGKIGSADVTGKLSWRMIQRLYVECMARDGEVIVALLKSKRNKAGFSLQFIDPELLDVEHNRTLTSGNRIVMGVELDKLGAPVAYHFRQLNRPDDDYYTYMGRDYVRMLAKDVIHDFITEDASQVRGVPWVASALMRLNMLNGYEEAELVASRVSAAKMGFFEQELDGTAVYQGDGADADGNIVSDAEAGTFEVLPAGMKFNAWDPQHPNSAFAAFVKATLRGISSGLGVGYNSFANDLEGVNYSSLRQGALDERAVWMALQDHVIESFHERVFARWLSQALLAGIVVGNGGTLRVTDFERYNVATWQARRWAWVDPKKEMDGHETAMRCLVRSPQRVIMEQGDDPDDVLADWDAWFKKLDAIGIPKELALAVFTGGAGGGLPDPMAEQAANE
jgi:lambda family phage portal protein